MRSRVYRRWYNQYLLAFYFAVVFVCTIRRRVYFPAPPRVSTTPRNDLLGGITIKHLEHIDQCPHSLYRLYLDPRAHNPIILFYGPRLMSSHIVPRDPAPRPSNSNSIRWPCYAHTRRFAQQLGLRHDSQHRRSRLGRLYLLRRPKNRLYYRLHIPSARCSRPRS